MTNLFGEEYEYPIIKKPVNKEKRNWENRFQRWIDKEWQDETTPTGMCGFGAICDYCKDNDKGRPCVRALNLMCKEENKHIDYTKNDYEKAWYGIL